jgi:ABC-2 type transport system permease protein
MEVLVQVLSASLIILLNWCLWTAIFDGRDQVAGRGGLELTTYVVVAWIATTFYANRLDQELAERFRTGLVAVDLLRPWNLQLHLYLRDLGRALVALPWVTLPVALWTALLLPLRVPVDPGTWLLVGLSLLLAHGISFGISWIFGVLSFRLRNAAGLGHLKGTLIALCSGALIPLDLYPEVLRDLVLLLPFQGMSHVPANLFVEHMAGTDRLLALGSQVAWVMVLALFGRWLFGRACRQLAVQGG